MSSSLTKGTLVTIIGEAVLQDRLIQLFTKVGGSGYTIIPAQGAGSHGQRMGDIAGYNTNIEVKTIVTSAASDQLLEDLGVADRRCEFHGDIAAQYPTNQYQNNLFIP